MGQAKRRRAEIEALKAAEALRAREECATNRLACAIHESAHLIAAFHFDVPVGERGVHIRSAEGTSDFIGFTNTLQSQLYGNVNELSDERRTEYMAQALIGPIAEYRLLNNRTDQILTFWANDIASAVGIPVEINHQRGFGRCSKDDVQHCTTLTTYCLTVIDNHNVPLPNVWPDKSNLLDVFQNAALLAERIRKQYEATIQSFASALINAPGMTFSGA